ncbi:MAG: hypothetical protein DRI90_14525 [Deltaproteobacteria bacterium]|nr:MAG: hypothetical protein DRI90_14525 [Deltaproteobacteria bacterium]
MGCGFVETRKAVHHKTTASATTNFFLFFDFEQRTGLQGYWPVSDHASPLSLPHTGSGEDVSTRTCCSSATHVASRR